MKIYTHHHWNITLPDNWVVEEDTDYTAVYPPDGVGDLLISSFEHDDLVTDDDLEEFAADHIESDVDSEDVEYGDFNGFSFCYSIENEYICEWYLKYEKIMLFITYSCPVENEENSEEDIVETSLNSLRRTTH